jgi:dihydroorotate dehydrogenase
MPAMADFYRFAGPLLRLLDPETAHRLAIRALRRGLVPARRPFEDPILAVRLWGRAFANPVGLAAGFDKDAEAVDGLFRLGFGFVEVGTVTPRPQAGNPRPRLFRLDADRAVINRLGFNNLGHAAMAVRLDARAGRAGVLGVNLGANRDSVDADADYVEGVRAFAGRADYLVVNVSSPNTPGLRALQGRERLARLLEAVAAALLQAKEGRPAVVVKIAPDLGDEDLGDIVEVALAAGVDGVAATNTTVARPPTLRDPGRGEAGGLSGRPLFAPSTDVLRRLFRLARGRLPLIGVGGVENGRQAYAKIRAGASLVQLYSALVFEGPGLVARIKRELAALLRADGFASVSEAVGADHR